MRLIQRFTLGILLAITIAFPVTAQNAKILATVVAACGTPLVTYTSGQVQPALQDVNGNLCVNVDATISGTVTANQGTANTAANAWPITPVIAGAVNSATNGLYDNLLQGNAVLSATNGLFVTPTTAAIWAMTPAILSPLGYQQFSAFSTLQTLTVPATATTMLMECDGQNIRWRDDGTNPTASAGFPLLVGSTMSYKGSLSAFAFIPETSSATCNVSYYK